MASIDPNKYKRISFDFDDQEHYGIRTLTGEACGLSMRLLCGLTQVAFARFQEFVGTEMIPNKFVSNDYATLMLTRNTLQDFIVYSACAEYQYVVFVFARATEFGTRNEEAYATNDPEIWQQLRERFANIQSRYYVRYGDAVGGMRNRHQFTGMTQ